MSQSKIIYKYPKSNQIHFITILNSQISIHDLKEKLSKRQGCPASALNILNEKNIHYKDSEIIKEFTSVILENTRRSLTPIPEEIPIKAYELKRIVQKARFFIMKSANQANIQISKTNNLWATTITNLNKIKSVFFETDYVLLFFTYKQANNFHGLALLQSIPQTKPTPQIWNCPQFVKLSSNFEIRWIKKNILPSHLIKNQINPLTGMQVTKGKDCQQIEKQLGKRLVMLFDQNKKEYVVPADLLIQQQQDESEEQEKAPQVDYKLLQTMYQTSKRMWENMIMEQKLRTMRYEQIIKQNSIKVQDSVDQIQIQDQQSDSYSSSSSRSNSSSSRSSSSSSRHKNSKKQSSSSYSGSSSYGSYFSGSSVSQSKDSHYYKKDKKRPQEKQPRQQSNGKYYKRSQSKIKRRNKLWKRYDEEAYRSYSRADERYRKKVKNVRQSLARSALRSDRISKQSDSGKMKQQINIDQKSVSQVIDIDVKKVDMKKKKYTGNIDIESIHSIKSIEELIKKQASSSNKEASKSSNKQISNKQASHSNKQSKKEISIQIEPETVNMKKEKSQSSFQMQKQKSIKSGDQ